MDRLLLVRIENTEDKTELLGIRAVNEADFGEVEEADLVDNLRSGGTVLVSLIAQFGSTIVGHVLFSRIWIETPSGPVPAVALAPVAVLPEHQRKGIGGQLIARGLDLLRGQGERVVIVLGHPSYYPRFGFSTEKAALLEAPFPREAFMAMELVDGSLAGLRGRVVYPPPFGV